MSSGRAEDLLLALAGAPAPSNLAPGEPAAPPLSQRAPPPAPAQAFESAARRTAPGDAAPPGAFAATRPAPSGYPDGSPPFSRQKLYHEPPPPSLPSQMHQVQPIAHPGFSLATGPPRNVQYEQKPRGSGGMQGARRFKCDWAGCTYESTGSGHMKRHMRTHTGERPYVCTWPGCTYSASQSGHLVQHMRSHTGERPFKCPVVGCDYAASRSGHLKRHMRVHGSDAVEIKPAPNRLRAPCAPLHPNPLPAPLPIRDPPRLTFGW